MVVHAHAKVNWSLAVTGIREDGYHLLDMLMQTVDLSDTLLVTPASGLSFTMEGDAAGAISEGDNLVLQAARLLRAASNTQQGAAIHLVKRIPAGAGLGGGSADAAATLRALNTLWELNMPPQALADLALFLGADVPFCLAGGLARVRGIGEEITQLPSAPEIPLVILQPEGGLSTPAVFRAYDAQPAPAAPSIDAVEAALLCWDIPALTDSMSNMLQPTAVGLCPEISVCLDALTAQGALHAQMTGSGSAVIGIFPTEDHAARAAAACQAVWKKCWATKSIASL